MSDLKGIDPEIATTAVKLQGIVHKKARLEADRSGGGRNIDLANNSGRCQRLSVRNRSLL